MNWFEILGYVAMALTTVLVTGATCVWAYCFITQLDDESTGKDTRP